MTKTVTAAYLMGIQDERQLVRDLEHRGQDVAELAPGILANVELTMAQGFSGDMLEYMRGSRDFWRNRVRKLQVAA